MKKEKNLLIVNYDFPPAGGAGVKRCLKFMKFLPEFGWNIVVLTVQNGNHLIIDKSLLKEVGAEIEVHRAYSFESFFGRDQQNQLVYENVDVMRSNFFGGFLLTRWLKKIYRTHGHFFKIPDSRILWIPGAITSALKLIWKKEFDVIFATGPTFVNFIVATLIKMMSKKPLVVDFRDAWLADPMLVKKMSKSRLRMHAALEKFVLGQANIVISTNPFVAKDFQRRYHYMDSSKFITIYNGYDIDDFAFMKEYKKNNKDVFTIVYTGRLYDERTPKYFLEALKLALEKEPEMRDKTRAIFVGSCEKFLDGRTIEDYLSEYNLKDVVVLTGHVSRKESLEYQMSASVLLLLIGIVPPEMELTYGLSGKVFDYLLSEKPILTLSNGGATREFLVENKIGKIFFHEEVKDIRDYLIKAYNRFTNGLLTESYDLAIYEKFDFRSLSKTLAEQFESIMNNRRDWHGKR